DRARGRVVTTELGPTFFNQPRGGLSNGRAPLLMGAGADRPMRNPSSRRRSPQVHARLLRLRDAFYPELAGQPPSAEWIGPMGFTPDQLPAIGLLRPGVIVVAGFNGYGGTYTTAAGEAAAIMSLTGKAPGWVPEDVFSPCRFLPDRPLFIRAHESLWRISPSLCPHLSTRAAPTPAGLACAAAGLGAQAGLSPPARSRWRRSAVLSSSPRPAADAAQLRQFATFREFELDELTELVTLMRRWEAPENTLLFSEGSAGRS